jgi:hypothetical protein
MPGNRRFAVNRYYLMVIVKDTEHSLWGPYESSEERDQAAMDHRREDPKKEDGLYPLDVNEKGFLSTGSY